VAVEQVAEQGGAGAVTAADDDGGGGDGGVHGKARRLVIETDTPGVVWRQSLNRVEVSQDTSMRPFAGSGVEGQGLILKRAVCRARA
jgi:hypothetical protein